MGAFKEEIFQAWLPKIRISTTAADVAQENWQSSCRVGFNLVATRDILPVKASFPCQTGIRSGVCKDNGSPNRLLPSAKERRAYRKNLG